MEDNNKKYICIENEMGKRIIDFHDNYWIMLLRKWEFDLDSTNKLRKEVIKLLQHILVNSVSIEWAGYYIKQNSDFNNIEEFKVIYERMYKDIIYQLGTISCKRIPNMIKIINEILEPLKNKISNNETNLLHTLAAQKDMIDKIL